MNALSDRDIAREIARDLDEGAYVNLGIGLPTLVAGEIPREKEVILHSENGILGVGPRPSEGEEDLDLVDAGKQPITLVTGGSYTSHVDSFSIVRGGHLDVAVMGAYEVSMTGDLANWSTGRGVPAVGGAMDLAVGAKRVFVMTRHNDKSGAPKLVRGLSLPPTGLGVVSRVYTELGIFEPDGHGFRVVGLAANVSINEVVPRTGAPVRLADDYRTIAHEAG